MPRDPATEDEIRRVAYTLWEAKGRPDGQDLENWLDAERKVERFFYFSFPRRGKLGSDESVKGLCILRLLVQHGLLLTPEFHARREFAGTPREVNTLVVQQRLCFTELNPRELPLHAREFGAFALEFDIKWARDIAAFPVLYFPNVQPPDAEGASWFGNSMICRIGALQHIMLPRLKAILQEAVAAQNRHDAAVIFPNIGEINAAVAFALLAYLISGTYLPEEIEPVLRASANLWAPTENIRYNNLMHYYQQREWRLTPSITRPGIQYDDLSDGHIQELLQLDPDYFTAQIDIPAPTQCVRACKVLTQVDGRPTFSYVRRVIVPQAAITEAEGIVAQVPNPPEVIALESLR